MAEGLADGRVRGELYATSHPTLFAGYRTATRPRALGSAATSTLEHTIRDADVRKTLKHILAEYGAIAVVVYLGMFFAVLGAAWGAINLGWQPKTLTANVGAFTAAYLATKVVQPFRIAATLALTPIVAAAINRLRRGVAMKSIPAPETSAETSRPASASEQRDSMGRRDPEDPAGSQA